MGSDQTRAPLKPRAKPSALRADGMPSQEAAEQPGSRPKPPKAVARSASLDAGWAAAYPKQHGCSVGEDADSSPADGERDYMQ